MDDATHGPADASTRLAAVFILRLAPMRLGTLVLAALLPAALALGVVAAPASAQTTIPDHIRDRLVEIGFSLPYASADSIYLPLLARGPKDGVSVAKDFAYGDHPRQRLDVYRPDGAVDAPVLVYVHGGAYASGERDINAEMYANVLTYFARHGMLGVNATYRLAPEATWPSGAEDMRGVVEWVKAHAAEHGGDPERIFMMGHSAGATHVATYAFDPRFQPADGHGLDGVVLVSGRYTIKHDPDDPSLAGIRRYFGDDPARYPSRSVVTHVPDSDIPAMLVIAEYDQRNLVETTGELFTALCERDDGRCPRLLQLRYHNHMSEIAHINTSDDLLGREILDFVREGAARQRRPGRGRASGVRAGVLPRPRSHPRELPALALVGLHHEQDPEDQPEDAEDDRGERAHEHAEERHHAERRAQDGEDDRQRDPDHGEGDALERVEAHVWAAVDDQHDHAGDDAEQVGERPGLVLGQTAGRRRIRRASRLAGVGRRTTGSGAGSVGRGRSGRFVHGRLLCW